MTDERLVRRQRVPSHAGEEISEASRLRGSVLDFPDHLFHIQLAASASIRAIRAWCNSLANAFASNMFGLPQCPMPILAEFFLFRKCSFR